MLIDVVDVAGQPDDRLTVRCRSAYGEVAAGWRGTRPAVRGSYHVEWTAGAALDWGRNASGSAVAAPGLWADGTEVVLRGLLRRVPEGVAALDLGETSVLLDLAGPVPGEVWETWIELRVPAGALDVYPYNL